jgi:hypothetical protein
MDANELGSACLSVGTALKEEPDLIGEYALRLLIEKIREYLGEAEPIQAEKN